MSDQFEPKDYRLARRAYESFHHEQPQVWFSELSHDYQMRWVNVIRAIRDELGRLGGRPSLKALVIPHTQRSKRFSSIEDAQSFLESFPRLKGGKFIDREGLSSTDLALIRHAQKYISNAKSRMQPSVNYRKDRRDPKKAE